MGKCMLKLEPRDGLKQKLMREIFSWSKKHQLQVKCFLVQYASLNEKTN